MGVFRSCRDTSPALRQLEGCRRRKAGAADYVLVSRTFRPRRLPGWLLRGFRWLLRLWRSLDPLHRVEAAVDEPVDPRTLTAHIGERHEPLSAGTAADLDAVGVARDG